MEIAEISMYRKNAEGVAEKVAHFARLLHLHHYCCRAASERRLRRHFDAFGSLVILHLNSEPYTIN